jgi:ABC-type bacteriocin/lantibiotic exporter with double-glycine peptidase domain
MIISPWKRSRVRYIPQLEMAECGAACLAMVLDHYGCSVPLSEVRIACGVSRDGSSAARVVRAARDYGLKAVGLKLEPKDLQRLPLPAILYWEFNHFVVLEKVMSRGVVIVDPASGRRRVPWSTFGGSYTGVALGFEPTAQLVPRARRSGGLARYLQVLASERQAAFYVLASALMLELLSLLTPTTIQVVLDHVIKPQRGGWLLPIAAALMLALVARRVVEWLRDRVMISLQIAMDMTLTTDFVSHLMRLPLGFFSNRQTGDLMQRVDANEELRAITAQLGMGAFDALMLLAYGGLMLVYDGRLGALALGLSLARMLCVQLARGRLREGSANLLSLSGREHGAMVEALASPEMLRAIGAEDLLADRYVTRMRARLNAEIGLKDAVNGILTGMTFFEGISIALVLWIGGSQVISGQMTLGVFAGFLTLQGLVDKPLSALFQCVDRYIYAQSILDRVDDVLGSNAEMRGQAVPAALRGEIVFDEVTFRHGPSAPALFEKLSFRIAAGEKVAIVGRSGQGKSTVLKLLLGVFTPESGRVLLDGVDLASISRKALAEHMGVVLQEPFLFRDSVENNLRMRVPDATHDEIVAAAKVACAHTMALGLTQGYATRLGEHGLRLSGGQRQRIAIARAIVRRPRILLLDEATSSLDLETEQTLHANLSSLGCTRLLIAHRLATVVDADRILVLDAGQIVQQGSYAELSSRPGLFHAMVEAQQG